MAAVYNRIVSAQPGGTQIPEVCTRIALSPTTYPMGLAGADKPVKPEILPPGMVVWRGAFSNDVYKRVRDRICMYNELFGLGYQRGHWIQRRHRDLNVQEVHDTIKKLFLEKKYDWKISPCTPFNVFTGCNKKLDYHQDNGLLARGVAVVSFGPTVDLHLRSLVGPIEERKEWVVPIHHGDMYVLRGESFMDMEHGVKVAASDERISLVLTLDAKPVELFESPGLIWGESEMRAQVDNVLGGPGLTFIEYLEIVDKIFAKRTCDNGYFARDFAPLLAQYMREYEEDMKIQ